MSRPDISPFLTHFTKGNDYEDAFARLRKIIASRKLIAGSGQIKGGFHCVCFTEMPILPDGLVSEQSKSKYSPFGICVSKQWLFERGGRPAIYHPESDYKLLPESLRWRHVRYELRDTFERTDFTWEREWRIKCDELQLEQREAQIVVLDQTWANRLIEEHDTDEGYKVRQYSVIFDGEIAQAYRDSFQWTILPLR
jgi:hypothetical protein